MDDENLLKEKLNIDLDWLKRASDIKATSKKLMGYDPNLSLYGLMLPHPQFRHLLAESGGSMTCNEKKRTFNYYLDNEDRVILTERFTDHSSSEPSSYIFYVYEEIGIFVYYYNLGRRPKLSTMYYLKLKQNGDIDIAYEIKPSTKDFEGYLQYTFEYSNGKVCSILRESKYSNFLGKPMYKSSRTMINYDDNSMDFDKEKMFNDLFEKISSWEEEDIYAISLYYEESDENFSVTLGYNTLSNYEDNIINASGELEAKWNYAFWLQNEELVFNFKKSLTLDKFINNLVKIVKKIHESKILIEKFGKKIPIIIHELEYYDEIVDINIKANTKSLIKEFIEFVYN